MKNRITPENITELKPGEIFVFGSNGRGQHFGGAAKIAVTKFGAIMGQPFGLQGRSFAIDTMTGLYRTKIHVTEFIKIAEQNPQKTFFVTAIGCGIAGFTPQEIAPLFSDAIEVENIHLPESFWIILNTLKTENV